MSLKFGWEGLYLRQTQNIFNKYACNNGYYTIDLVVKYHQILSILKGLSPILLTLTNFCDD